MADDDPFAGLAPAYHLALSLESEGVTTTEMAERLDIPVESVRSFLRLAHAKAAALEAAGRDDVQPDGC